MRNLPHINRHRGVGEGRGYCLLAKTVIDMLVTETFPLIQHKLYSAINSASGFRGARSQG